MSGSWQLAGLDGDGTLIGGKEKETITLNLHPNWADHNFMMHGTAQNGRFEGKWEFVGFAGPMKGGTFQATRQGTR